jgi:DNA-binding NarL/FixJ family response regulator
VSDDSAVTVVVAHFDGLMGCGLMAELQKDRRVQVLASDLAGVALERAVARHQPRVVIFDEAVDHAFLVGLESRKPAIGAVVLAHRPSQVLRTSLLAVGVTCLARAASPAELLAAIHSAAQGQATFYRADDEASGGGPVVADVLTEREAQVFELLSRGRSYVQIARAFQIAPETARSHTISICQKLDVKSKRQLRGKSLSTRL